MEWNQVEKIITRACRAAIKNGNRDVTSYKTLKADLSGEITAEDFKKYKQQVMELAGQILRDDAARDTQTADKGEGSIKKKLSSANKVQKRKKSEPGFKSKEFINSDGDPTSAAPDGLEDDVEEQTDARPKKKPKKKPADGEPAKKAASSKPARKVTDPVDADTEEINRLKELVKACGLRTLQKELADKSQKEIIKHLKQKLKDVGMEGRLSMAKAKEIKAKRELDKETADLLGSNTAVNLSGGRTSRAQAKPVASTSRNRLAGIVPDSESDDAHVHSAHSVDESEDEIELERQETQKDKQAGRKVNSFAKVAKSMGII